MLELSYKLKKSDEVILYGAATIGKLMYNRLMTQSYNVIGFMDKRAIEISSYCGLPVFSIDSNEIDKENTVIILSVKNVFEHSRIVNKLSQIGYKKIIYRPFDTLNGGGTKDEKIINDMYDLLTEGEISDVDNIEIPKVDIYKEIKLSEQGVVSRNGELIISYIPISILFTDKKEGVATYSILFLQSHINFVKYVLGLEGGEKQHYIDFCKKAALKIGGIEITKAWKENVLSNRAEVFLHMNHIYNTEPEYFIKNAPYVEWNYERKVFHLQSGKHRTAFLLAMGLNYIPVKMNKADYEEYTNMINISKIRDELDNKVDKGMIPPIENPYFYDYSYYVENIWFNILKYCVSNIFKNYYVDFEHYTLNALNIGIAVDDSGFLKRYFERVGCKISILNDLNSIECIINGKKKYNQVSNDIKYDLAIVDENNKCKINSCNTIIITSNQNENLVGSVMGIFNGKKIFIIEKGR